MARFASAFAVALWFALFAHAGHAGPYTEPGHAIAAMIDWAAEVEDFDRGPMNIANPGLGDASHGQPEDALGPAPGNDVLNVVSLGDGGSLTLFFPNGISDGAGDDFAVFENAFFAPDGLRSKEHEKLRAARRLRRRRRRLGGNLAGSEDDGEQEAGTIGEGHRVSLEHVFCGELQGCT